MSDWNGDERRTHPPISEELLEQIAERAARKVMDNMYRDVGKSLITKVVWAAGVLGVAIAMWVSGKAPN
jgi:hypothetical protein